MLVGTANIRGSRKPNIVRVGGITQGDEMKKNNRAKLVLIYGPRGSGKTFAASDILSCYPSGHVKILDDWMLRDSIKLLTARKKYKVIVVVLASKSIASAMRVILGRVIAEFDLSVIIYDRLDELGESVFA